MSKIPEEINKLSFEKAMEELSEIVENLESGNIDLEKSIEYYTRGSHLKSHCQKKLDEAVLKLDEIKVSPDGKILKKLEEQRPDFLLISAGFDAHTEDPLASLDLVENDFRLITSKLRDIANKYCGGKIISMLEGGYDIKALENSMITHLSAVSYTHLTLPTIYSV